MISEQCAVTKVTRMFEAPSFPPWHRPTIILPFVYCPVDNTLFDVSPEIRCSSVSSCDCCHRNHAAGSKPI